MKTMPFIDKLRYWAKNDGGQTALLVGGERLTYAELLHAAEAGVAGSVVAADSCTPDSCTPDSCAAESAAAEGAEGAEGAAGSVAAIDRPTSVELVIDFCTALLGGRTAMVMDAGWPATLRRQLTESAETWAGSHDLVARPFLLGLSSGTSGLPKAFVRSAVSWSESFVRSTEYFNLGADGVMLAPGPLAASMNLYALGESIHAGSTFVALPRFSPDAALDAMAEHPVNRLVLVPTLLEMMAARGLETGQDGGQLESIVCAGSALPERTLALTRQWAPNALIQHYYGAAELGFVAASTVQPATMEPSPGAGAGAGVGTADVGTAFPGVEISIRDDHGHEVAMGQQGNICVRSPYVCSGYAWGDDGLAFTPLSARVSSPSSRSSSLRASEPQTTAWHTVHDQGHVDGNGVLHVAGRASEMIITSGANVYPHAVEEGLAAGCDEAATVVVTGVADPLRGQRIAAGIFIPEGGGHLDVAALRRAAARLPAHHRPGLYFSLGAMPLTGSGKPSRALLGQWITEGDARAQRIR